MSDHQVEIFNSFYDAENRWKEFQEASSMLPFQNYDFLRIWYENIGVAENISPLFVSVKKQDGVNLLFMPFGVRKLNFLHKLEWLGLGLCDYGAPILHKNFSKLCSPIEFSKIWLAIKEKLENIDLIKLENQPLLIGNQLNPFIPLSKDSLITRAYCASLPKDWSDFIQIEPRKKITSDSLRQQKRLNNSGLLTINIVDNENEIKNILDELIKQKEFQYHQSGAFNIFSKTGYRKFYLDTCIELIPKGIVQLSAIRIDQEIIACHWGLIYQNRYYFLMPSYRRDEWAKYSPGRILMEYLIKWAIENQIKEFDFTVGNEPYKKSWSTQEDRLYELVEFKTFSGVPAYLLWLIKLRIRSCKFLYNFLIKIQGRLSKIH